MGYKEWKKKNVRQPKSQVQLKGIDKAASGNKVHIYM